MICENCGVDKLWNIRLWCNGSISGSNPLGQGSNPWGRANYKTR